MARFISVAIAGLILTASIAVASWNQTNGLYIS